MGPTASYGSTCSSSAFGSGATAALMGMGSGSVMSVSATASISGGSSLSVMSTRSVASAAFGGGAFGGGGAAGLSLSRSLALGLAAAAAAAAGADGPRSGTASSGAWSSGHWRAERDFDPWVEDGDGVGVGCDADGSGSGCDADGCCGGLIDAADAAPLLLAPPNACAAAAACTAAACTAGGAPCAGAGARRGARAPCGGASCTSDSGCAWVLSRFGGREVLADYEFGRALGRGTFGVTRLVTERVSARPFACKTVCKERISSRQYVEDMRSEVRILQHLVGVPGVVQLRGAYEDCRAVNLVLELCAGGDLLDHILKLGRLPEHDAAAAARAIVLALQRCHARGVAHRDVKPENFLLAAAGCAASCRVADFGVSAFFTPGQKFHEIVGTPYYMAPEVLLRCYDQSADIWSAGVVLYLMLSGTLPFMGPSDRAVCAAVLGGAAPRTDGPGWAGVSDGAKAVVARMLCRDPRARATPEELLAHPWLARDAVVVAVAAAQATAPPPAPKAGAAAPQQQQAQQAHALPPSKAAAGPAAIVVAATAAAVGDCGAATAAPVA